MLRTFFQEGGAPTYKLDGALNQLCERLKNADELMAFDDRMLRDIALTRYELVNSARFGLWRGPDTAASGTGLEDLMLKTRITEQYGLKFPSSTPVWRSLPLLP